MRKELTAKHVDYETPMEIYLPLDKEFHFDIDLAANDKNKKCATFFSVENDGLKNDWRGQCWCNPPYGNKVLSAWVEKAWRESQSGRATIVMLLPVHSNTDWWHTFCLKAEIRFLRGRPSFIRGDGNRQTPLFPLAIVIFRAKILKVAKHHTTAPCCKG